MIETLLTPEALPFAVALLVVAALLALEVFGLLVGASVGGVVDEAMPDLDGPDADGSFLESALGWLSFGKVPALVLLILGLTGFGLSGLLLQGLDARWLDDLLPTWAVAVPAALVGLGTMRWVGGVFGRLMPKEETAAISRAQFVGMGGIVSQGTARRGMAAPVRVTDAHGTMHYVQAEPEEDDETFASGSRVIIISVEGSRARVIADSTY